MNVKYKDLMRRLSELDKEAQIIDAKIKEIRIEINNLCWSLIDLKKSKDESSCSKRY